MGLVHSVFAEAELLNEVEEPISEGELEDVLASLFAEAGVYCEGFKPNANHLFLLILRYASR